MSPLSPFRRWIRGRQSKEMEAAVQQAVQHAHEVNDRVERQALEDKSWDALRRRYTDDRA